MERIIGNKNINNDDIIVVEGNKTLTGKIAVSGAKNSVLKLMAASILARQKCIIKNVPYISDITIMSKVLEKLGACVQREDDVLTIDTQHINKVEASYFLVSKMRASIAVLGPLIARFGHAKIALPGGCQIGERKIDMHMMGLKLMGVEFKMDHGYLIASTPKGLHGANIILDFPSVGATENVLMAAVCAKGITIIDNAAREPEIVDLCNFLNKIGAHVSGGGTSVITIEGQDIKNFCGTTHTTIGDRIEAGTFLAGGALTGGPLTIEGVKPEYLKTACMKLKEMGAKISQTSNSITVKRDINKDLQPIELQTLPHPGFPTDLQAQFMLLANYANGTSVITENLFENRFMFAAELARMGADITLEEHHALVHGPKDLQGAPVSSTDLRAGGSLVLAGIMAEGRSIITKVKHIDRGYEFFVEKLQHLGANVQRLEYRKFIEIY